jgi:hypothetical protein
VIGGDDRHFHAEVKEDAEAMPHLQEHVVHEAPGHGHAAGFAQAVELIGRSDDDEPGLSQRLAGLLFGGSRPP